MTKKEELINRITREELYQYWIVKNYNVLQMMEYFNLKKRWELPYILHYYKFPRKPTKLTGKNSSKTQKISHSIHTQENRKNRLCRSVAEQLAFDEISRFYPDVLYDVRIDNRYPYYVDFYIPSLDLFIELNAHPSHGKLPIKYLAFEEYSQYPTKWADVFARRDVEKQKIAHENKINYIMIYPQASLKENYKINHSNNEIIKKIYESQFNR